MNWLKNLFPRPFVNDSQPPLCPACRIRHEIERRRVAGGDTERVCRYRPKGEIGSYAGVIIVGDSEVL